MTAIVALDVPTQAEALSIVDELGELCSFYKVGLELFAAVGPPMVRALRAAGCEVFLDLKLHDIPNTVRGAVRSAAGLGARLVTVHASGGLAMLRAAAEGAVSSKGRCEVLAVSVLTSLTEAELAAVWGRPTPLSVEAEVVRLAGIARTAGVAGLVCSGAEAKAVRAEHGDALALLIPGIRLAEGTAHDQARVATPRRAAEVGARWIVVGRAVTAAPDPRGAMRAVLGEIT